MTRPLGVNTGRHWMGRLNGKANYCESCNARLTYGEANPNALWYPRLQLSEDQVNFLLIAAAEFSELSRQADDPADAVEFVDWLRPSVIGDYVAPPDFDGAPPRTHEGLPTTERRRGHRHPDPLPVASLQHWRKP